MEYIGIYMPFVPVLENKGDYFSNIQVRSHFWEWGPLQRNHPVAVMPSSFLVPFPPESPQTCHAEWAVLRPFMPSCSVGYQLSTVRLISSSGSRPIHQLRIKCCSCALFNILMKVCNAENGISLDFIEAFVYRLIMRSLLF